MSGKIRVEDYLIVNSFDLGSDLKEVREYLSRVDFSVPGIHILSLQPGIGKSHAIKNFLKGLEKFLLVSSRHKLLSQEYKGLGAEHWAGLNEDNCEKFKKVKNYYGIVSIGLICDFMNCDKRRCKYWKQFNTKKALAPLNYLPTDRVQYRRGDLKGHFKFDMLVVDESMDAFNSVEFDKNSFYEALDVIDKYMSTRITKEDETEIYYPVREIAEKFMSYFGTADIPPLSLTIRFHTLIKETIWLCVMEKNFEDLDIIAKINAYNLRKYIYYYNIYGDLESYPEPFIYHALDLAFQGVPVVFLDATFDNAAFQVIMGRYLYENSIIPRQELIDKSIDIETDLSINLYQSRFKDKNVTIYRMDKENNYYKKTFFSHEKEGVTEKGQETIDWLRESIIWAKRKFRNVGIITYQGLEKYFHDLGPVEYFFNLKGSNQLLNMEAIFIIGTPLTRPTDSVKGYNNLCLTNINHKDTYKPTYTKIDGEYYKKDSKKIIKRLTPWTEKKPLPLMLKGYDGYENELKYDQQEIEGLVDTDVYYPLPDYDLQQIESEKYQAIHRARPFREGKAPEIYVYGDMPDHIKEEFEVIYKDKFSSAYHFKVHGIYPLQLFDLITRTYAIKQNALDTATILKILKRKPAKGPNTKFITKIVNGSINFKNIIKIHEMLINNPRTTPDDITSKIKIDKEFVEDILYYSGPGGRIIKILF